MQMHSEPLEFPGRKRAAEYHQKSRQKLHYANTIITVSIVQMFPWIKNERDMSASGQTENYFSIKQQANLETHISTHSRKERSLV